jgi:hypothetical protein
MLKYLRIAVTALSRTAGALLVAPWRTAEIEMRPTALSSMK